MFRVILSATVAKRYHVCMPQPVKLSDDLVLEARTVGAVACRSIAGQVEFWARLGKSIESVLRGDRALALQRSGAAESLAQAIESVDTDAGRKRVAMRVLQGGHDVPDEKLTSRFPRTLANLERAISMLPVVIVFDNTDLAQPFQLDAVYRNGTRLV